jgi:hypothetical protein
MGDPGDQDDEKTESNAKKEGQSARRRVDTTIDSRMAKIDRGLAA